MSVQAYGARWVVPIDGDPIEYGEVVVEDGVILAVRPSKLPSSDRHDFGHSVLMPGFVNAHTHLEYNVLRGFLEDVPFFPWVRALNEYKSALEPDDWLFSTRLGAAEAIRSGVTTIGDNTDAGFTAQVASESGIRAKVFTEVFGIDHRDNIVDTISALTKKLEDSNRYVSDRVKLGISPHALYTVRPDLMAALNELANHRSFDYSIHVAESDAECQLTEHGRGPFAEMFSRRGIIWDTPKLSPTLYAKQLGALRPKSIAVHCVQQTDQDIAELAESGASVVHCPKSNAKLGAGFAPLAKWLQYPNLTVGIGTDSVVSNNTIDMFDEMRFSLLSQRALAKAVPTVTAKQILTLATLGGAQALGFGEITGSLTPGKRADMICVSLQELHSWPYSEPYAAVVFSGRPDNIAMTMTDGDILFNGTILTTLPLSEIVLRTREARERASRIIAARTGA